VRLFPTLASFNGPYHYPIRCNLKKLTDFASLWVYACALCRLQDVVGTARFDIYRQGYFSASQKRNPIGIVPIAPHRADWEVRYTRQSTTWFAATTSCVTPSAMN
jgi:glutathionyl-hydroquinone reductase